MTIIQKYKCDICHTEYEKKEDALCCENQGIKPPKAKIGDTVFVWFKYRDNPLKPFCKRIITEVITAFQHEAEYAFDKSVCVAGGTYIGSDSCYMRFGETLASEDQFYLLGEVLNVFDTNFKDKKMSLDFVDESG